jgi:hypothetical protein
VVVGSDMLHDKYFPIINAPKDPMDRLATDVIMSTKRIGQLPAVRVPYMPTGKLMITRLDNLSIYYQEGHQRRMLRDEPQYNRVVDYQSSNEAYVVEDANLPAWSRTSPRSASMKALPRKPPSPSSPAACIAPAGVCLKIRTSCP